SLPSLYRLASRLGVAITEFFVDDPVDRSVEARAIVRRAHRLLAEQVKDLQSAADQLARLAEGAAKPPKAVAIEG
ncbi:MAG TPA: hypothetical protein VIV06_01600, partial [Candidatus Limnocylindrales bacterium]